MSTESRQPVHRITLDSALGLRLMGYAVALFYVALGIVLALDSTGAYQIGSLRSVVFGSAGAVVVCAGTILLHEGVHGLFMRLFGATPKYGVGRMGHILVYAYATAPGVPFTLTQTIAICLAPFVIISAAALAVGGLVPQVAGFAALAFVTNFSGAAGDLWMVGQIWRFRQCRDLSFVDSMTSLEIYSSDPAAAAVAAALTARQDGGVLRRLFLRWVLASSLILIAAIPVAVLLAALKSDDVTIGPRQFAIATFEAPPDGGLSMSLNLNAVVVFGLICALLSLIVVRPSKRRVADEPPSAGSPHPAFL